MRLLALALRQRNHIFSDGLSITFACTIPATPSIQRDDAMVRITRWDFAPGAATGWHSHAWAYFVVMLTDATMMVHDGAHVTEISRRAGDPYQRPAGIEHDIMNGADEPMAFIEIEIKKPTGL